MTFMTRRWWLMLTIAGAGCGPAREDSAPALPAQNGRWTLAGVATPVPDRVGAAKAAWRATYAGTPPVTLTVYGMPSETNAFDALQRWRPAPGKLAFYKGRYFCIAESDGAAFPDLNAFTTGLQASLPAR